MKDLIFLVDIYSQ